MPVIKYFVCVGAALFIGLMISANYLPQPQSRSENQLSYKIAIRSHHRGPEAISFSGENQIFGAPLLAASYPNESTQNAKATATIDASKLNDNVVLAAATLPIVKRKKLAKRKVRQRTKFHMEMVERSQFQDVTYSQNLPGAPVFAPRMF